eukprot:366517-Chlamydomonas_euryale.AAC.10
MSVLSHALVGLQHAACAFCQGEERVDKLVEFDGAVAVAVQQVHELLCHVVADVDAHRDKAILELAAVQLARAVGVDEAERVIDDVVATAGGVAAH